MSEIIKALAPWFGGKRLLSSRIIEQLGSHASYWEPFCGSMAVLLAKKPANHEHVNDLHGDLVNLARVVQDDDLAPRLYDRAARTLMCEALFQECRDWWIERPCPGLDAGLDLERAYRYLVCSWMGRNGMSGTLRYHHTFAVRWTKDGGHGATRWRTAVESIPWWHERLRQVVILQRDAFAVLASIEDQQGTAIYVDPPYLIETRARTGGGGRYQHDFEDEQHLQLAQALARFEKARVVVSYYASPRLMELYQGWTVIECPVNKQLSTNARHGSNAQQAPEVLLVNGPALGQGLFGGV